MELYSHYTIEIKTIMGIGFHHLRLIPILATPFAYAGPQLSFEVR